MNGFIGTREAAKRLKISVRRVQALIAAGRLSAEKIGNTYAIREADLAVLSGRKNGRPKPTAGRTQEEWNQILDKFIGCLKGGPSDLATNKKYMEEFGRKSGRFVGDSRRIERDWDAILDRVLGKHDFGPSDLATNKKHLEGLGRD